MARARSVKYQHLIISALKDIGLKCIITQFKISLIQYPYPSPCVDISNIHKSIIIFQWLIFIHNFNLKKERKNLI